MITDKEFDLLEEKLRKIDPKNSYFSVVGSVVKAKTKVQHEVPMLSCDKCKTIEEITKWVKKIGMEGRGLLAEPKIDGISCSILYRDGKLERVATRGDGKVGQDITHIIEHIRIPKKIDWKGLKEVRGELYLPKDTKLPNPEGAPLRNLASGLINRKDSGMEDLRFIRFIAYQLLDLESSEEYLLPRFENNKLVDLWSMRFDVVNWKLLESVTDLEKYFKKYLSSLRDDWLYETDGLVLVVNDTLLWKEIDAKYTVHHHHFYNMALKPPSSTAETILESIDWQVSRFGKVVPTANVKPVLIDGRMVKRAGLSNYKNVVRMRLEKGDKVLIEVANDVIPYLSRNISKGIDQR